MASTAPSPWRGPVPRALIAELAAYVGGPIALAGVGLVVARHAVGIGGQAVIVAVVFAAFVALGAAVGDRRPATLRLRSVAWFGAVLAWTAFVQVLLFGVAGTEPSRGLAVLDALAVGAVAAVVWWLCRRTLQQVAVFVVAVAIVVAITLPTPSLLGFDTTTTGLVLWILGLLWFAAGARRLLHPRRAALVLGAVAAVVAPVYLLRQESLAGEIIGLVTAIGFLLAGDRLEDRAVEGVAIAGVVIGSGAIVSEHLGGSEPGAWIALAAGVALLGIAVALARSADAPPPGATGTGPLPAPPDPDGAGGRPSGPSRPDRPPWGPSEPPGA
jgi:hypothetical protein